jgi:hypothetical protein
MKCYLGLGLVKGIGPVLGGRIVDAFGEETFTLIVWRAFLSKRAGMRSLNI